jgi:hypothetical protein
MGIEELLLGLVAGLVVVGPGLLLWAVRRTAWLEGLVLAGAGAGVWMLVRAECGGEGAGQVDGMGDGCALVLQGAATALLGWSLVRAWRPGVLAGLLAAWLGVTGWAVLEGGPPEARSAFDGWSVDGALWAAASTLVLGPLALAQVLGSLAVALVLPAGWLGGPALAMARPRRVRLLGLAWLLACVPAVRSSVESGAHRALWSRIAESEGALPFPGMQLALSLPEAAKPGDARAAGVEGPAASGESVRDAGEPLVEWLEVVEVEGTRLRLRSARRPWEDGTGVRADGSLPEAERAAERWVAWPLAAGGPVRLRW